MEWREELEGQLGDRTSAVREALVDVSEIIGSTTTPAGFWSRRGTGDDESVMVYVLASGVLHRLRGKLDPEQEIQDGKVERECEHQIAPITKASTYELKVTSTWGANQTGGITRDWQFEIGQFGRLQFTSSRDQLTSGPDPTPLARALAAEIVRVRSTPRDDA